MVIEDPFRPNFRPSDAESGYDTIKGGYEAPILARLLSAVLDYLILSPISLFLATTMMRDGLRLVRELESFSQSGRVLLHFFFLSAVIFAALQTIFILIYGASPGQILTKLRIKIENQNFSRFLHVFFRQLGFVFSTLFLGLPWLAVMYHPKRRALYDRLTDTTVYSIAPSSKNSIQDLLLNSERRYVGMAFSTAILFLIALFLVEWKQEYQALLEKPQIETAQSHAAHARCPEIESQDPIARLQFTIAMNFVKFVSDVCLRVETDVHLWQNFSSRRSEIESWAFLGRMILADSPEQKLKYRELACEVDSSFPGCLIAARLDQNKTLDQIDMSFLGRDSFLKRFFAFHNGQDSESALALWKSNSLVQRYLVTQQLVKFLDSDKIDSGFAKSRTDDPRQESKNVPDRRVAQEANEPPGAEVQSEGQSHSGVDAKSDRNAELTKILERIRNLQ